MRSRLRALAADPDGRAARAGPPRGRRGAGRGLGPSRRTGAAADPAAATAALGEVAGALRSGTPPALAWRRVGVETSDGVPSGDVVGLATGLTAPHARAVGAACRLATELGVPYAALLEQVTLAIARDAEARDRRRAALAGPRSAARLLAGLPLAGLGVGFALGADPVSFLLRPGGGPVLLAAGGALAVIGHTWTRREVRLAEAAGENDT